MDIVWPNGTRMNMCPTGHRPGSIWTVAFTSFLGPVHWARAISAASIVRFPFRSLLSSPLVSHPTNLRNSFSDIHLIRLMSHRAAAVREKFPQFRILVIGQANAGKTTLLQRVCKTTESPIVRNRNGHKVTAESLCQWTAVS